jgi:hypothetical protein
MAVATVVRRIGAGVVAVGLIATAVVVTFALRRHGAIVPSCQASAAGSTYTLDVDQAANSTTIAAVGKRLGLPDHAVTIALAAALQESKLRNLPYGDRDSLGLFQQRPSQGWGTSTEILTPSYAAAAFFRALQRVPSWETLPITDAAQKVQLSGAPTAYAQWESEARTLAVAITGETAAGLSCHFALERSQDPAPIVSSSMKNELGVATLDSTFSQPRGWMVASWLVGHAQQFRVTTVSFRGQEWRAKTGRWQPTTPSDGRVRFAQQPVS